MGYRSNYHDVNRALGRLSGAFALRRRSGGSRRLGDEIADLVAATIYERTRLHKLGPDGSPLPPLKPSTIRRKLRKGYPPTLGVETGAMLEKGQIRGDPKIGDDTVELTYGLDPDAAQKAEWFQEGRPGVQEPRFFYDLGDDGAQRLDEYIEEVAEAARADFEGA